MIILQDSDNFDQDNDNFGAISPSRDLTVNKDYICNNPKAPGMCYGIGEVHKDSVGLQAEINRFAAKAGFRRIKTDGMIGAGTVAAAQKVSSWIQANVPKDVLAPILPTISMSPVSKEVLASQALYYGNAIQAITNNVLKAPPTPRPGEPPVPSPPPEQEREPGADAEAKPSNIWWWVAGGAAVVGASLVGYLVYRRRAAGPAPSRAPSRRSRPGYAY